MERTPRGHHMDRPDISPPVLAVSQEEKPMLAVITGASSGLGASFRALASRTRLPNVLLRWRGGKTRLREPWPTR